MKIGIISTGVFPCSPVGYSGLEMIAWQVATGLAAKGHEVTLFAPDGSICQDGEVFFTGPPGSSDEKQAYSRYWQELPKYQVILDHSWQKWSYILKEEGRLKETVIVSTLHAPVSTMYQTLPPVEKPSFVCISEDQASHFRALHGRDCRVAKNGVDTEFYQPLNVPRTSRFLFLARFSSIKGADIAITVCNPERNISMGEHCDYCDNGCDVPYPHGCIHCGIGWSTGLDLVGDVTITGEPEYLTKCQAMADGKRIKIHGGVPRGQTVWWYSQAHCFLHPNQRFREPLGLAPLEAQACGLPVIAWRFGAMTETVKDGETGTLVNSVADMALAVRKWSEPISPEIRNRCREWAASNFSLERMISRYEELCVEALDT